MRAEAGIQSDTSDAANDTLSARAERLLERDILSGALVPGARLGIAELVARYAISATPIREALSRLVPRGLIIALSQRGFRVASVSENDLVDITMNRVLIETEALRRSMRHGGPEWEASALAALHRLQRHIEQFEPDWRNKDEEFDRLHKVFHTALIAGCGSARMLTIASDLYDQAFRYRRLMMAQMTDGTLFVTQHRELLNAAFARDEATATTMLTRHLRTTLRMVYPQADGTP